MSAALAIAALAAGASLVGAQPGGPVSPVFPDEPRAVGGTDSPLADLPGPRECSRARDRRGRRDYTPLADLPARRSTNPYAPGTRVTLALQYQNRKDQRFTIYVSARRESVVRRYIAEASICLEQFRPGRGARAAAIEQVDLGKLLVAAAVVATGRTRGDLSAVRDGLAATAQDTLTGTVTTLGGDVAAVIAAAATAATAELQAKVAAGELTAAEVAAFNLQDRLTQLADESGAPFLYDPAELANSVGALGRSVNRDRRRVAIGLRARTAPRARRVVWYAVDGGPPARKANGPYWISGTHDYISECRRQAWTQIAVWVGKASVHLWRVSPFHDVGTRSASVGSGLSSMLIHPATPANTKKYYDVSVKNKRQNGNSRYSIYGGWERGSGRRAC